MRGTLLSKVCFLVPLVLYVAIYFADGTVFHPNGDGFYSWLFARSLVFDGDFSFANDYALCGDPFGVAVDRGTGHLDNPFYVGPAVFWIGPALLLRVFFSAAGSCGGWFTALTILAGPVCGAFAVWFAFRAAELVVAPKPAAVAALLFAFSSPLFPYATSIAHYSHVYLTFLVSVVTYVALRSVARAPGRADGLVYAVVMSVAVLHRLPAALYVVIPAAAFVALFRRGRAPWGAIVGAALGVAGGVAATCALYKYLYGTWVALPQGPDYVHLDHAHPWLLLFGVHGGFFFWMPAAWLAVFGAARAWRTRPRMRLMVLAIAAAAGAEVLVSAAPLDWHGNWSLGARRLLPLTPLVVVLAAHALDGLGAFLRRRLGPIGVHAAALVLLVLVLVNNIPAATTIRGDQELSQQKLYGALSPLRPVWGALDRAGVDVALLPAELYFVGRYRLAPREYRTVLKPWFRRDFLTLEWADTELATSLDVAPRARLVSAMEWPFATHVRLLVTNATPVRLTMEAGTVFGWKRIGTVDLPAATKPQWTELAIPAGAYDSGINEWRFRVEEGRARITAVKLDDRTPRVPHVLVRRRVSTDKAGSASEIPAVRSP